MEPPHLPTQSASIQANWAKVPPEVKGLIKRMLVVDPAERISMEDVKDDPCLLQELGPWLITRQKALSLEDVTDKYIKYIMPTIN